MQSCSRAKRQFRVVRRVLGRVLAQTLLAANLAALAMAAPPIEVQEGGTLGAEFEYRLFPIQGGQLACAHRQGAGPSLVLIPGTFADSRVFAAAVEHLDKSLNLVLIENRGLGRSWPPPERGAIEDLARDDLFIVDELNIETFFVGGHSLGGMISLEIGRQAPQRVQGIISIEGWTNAQAARDAFQGDMSSTLSEAQLRTRAEYRKEVLARWSTEQVRELGQAWRRWDGTTFVNETSLPILELYGDRGKRRPDRALLGLPDRKNIRLVWFEGASHSLLMERPALVAAEINGFVRDLASKPKEK